MENLYKRNATNLINYTKIKKQRHYFANKHLSSQNYGFSSPEYSLEGLMLKLKLQYLLHDAKN